jgi:hypothetical protein
VVDAASSQVVTDGPAPQFLAARMAVIRLIDVGRIGAVTPLAT